MRWMRRREKEGGRRRNEKKEEENHSDRLCITDLGSGAVQPCGGGEIGHKLRDLHIDS